MPTLRMVMSLPGTMSAATIGKAADEGSPGTSMICGRNSASPVMVMMRPSGDGSVRICAPKPASMRSLWSRVATGSITLVSPGVFSPASNIADFT